MNNHNNRVVVTGIGILCPLGLSTSVTWEGLIAGKSGIDYITLFDPEPLDTKFAGEVKGFEPTDYINRKDARRMDRFAQLAVAASLQAVEKAGLQINSTNEDNIGVIIGSGIGGLTTLFEQTRILIEKGPQRVSPFLVPMMIADMASAQVSIALRVKGPNICTTSACSSGSDAIGAGYELIKRGNAQVMIVGGADAIINQLGISAFNALKALSTRNSEPQLASRPFDADRDGFVIAEGAGVVILESWAHAQARQAPILAEIAGVGMSNDAYHITSPLPEGEGGALAMAAALKDGGIKPEEVQYINAHGTSTGLGDVAEVKAIKRVFGEHAQRLAISSTKSMIGHCLGAAGGIELKLRHEDESQIVKLPEVEKVVRKHLVSL